jgi:hypothetical protein
MKYIFYFILILYLKTMGCPLPRQLYLLATEIGFIGVARGRFV